MNTGAIISAGCIIAGAALVWAAVRALGTGTTLAGRGGPGGPITREDRPGYFWFLFWVRIVLGPIAVVGGLAGLDHVL